MNDDQKQNEQKKEILTPEKKPDSATKAVAIILLGVLILSLVIFPIIILINRSGINNAALDLTDNRKNILVYFSVFIMTIFAYLFFPVLYRLVNGKVDRKRATRIALFNSIVVAVLFRLLEAVLNTDVAFNATTFAPAFFYFWIAKEILQQKSNEKTMKDKTTDLPPENAMDFVDGTYSYRVAEIEHREGAVAYFSPQEILIRIIDLLTAHDVLTEEDYKIVRIIYDHYRSLREKKPLSFPDFLKLQNEMIAHFDLIGPYYLFSGSEPTKEAEAAESRKHGYRERAKKILARGYLFGSDWMRLHQAFYEAFYTPKPDKPSETAPIKSVDSHDSKLEAPQDAAASDERNGLPQENTAALVSGTYYYRVSEIERREGAVAYFSPREIMIRIINLLTAEDVLTEKDYKLVSILYDHYRSLKEKKILSFPDFLKLQNEMIAHFDLIAPYCLFSGSEPTKEAETAESKKHGYRERAKKILANGYLFGSDWMRLHREFYDAFYAPKPNKPSEDFPIKPE